MKCAYTDFQAAAFCQLWGFHSGATENSACYVSPCRRVGGSWRFEGSLVQWSSWTHADEGSWFLRIVGGHLPSDVTSHSINICGCLKYSYVFCPCPCRQWKRKLCAPAVSRCMKPVAWFHFLQYACCITSGTFCQSLLLMHVTWNAYVGWRPHLTRSLGAREVRGGGRLQAGCRIGIWATTHYIWNRCSSVDLVTSRLRAT